MVPKLVARRGAVGGEVSGGVDGETSSLATVWHSVGNKIPFAVSGEVGGAVGGEVSEPTI